ncbi:MAG: hypothetical protein ABIV26_02145, partial [Candidatus Limnocylindrales bacterium]
MTRRSTMLVMVLAFVAACTSTPAPTPGPLAIPTADATQTPRTTLPATGGETPGPTPAGSREAPSPPASPGAGGSSEIIPGTVGRSSLLLSATYSVHATIGVAKGSLDVTTVIHVRNDSSRGIDRLDLNTIAARLGQIRVTSATVDDVDVVAAIDDQTIRIPLGGILPEGAATNVRIAYRATL